MHALNVCRLVGTKDKGENERRRKRRRMGNRGQRIKKKEKTEKGSVRDIVS